ncbi:hypothetical protein AB6806_28545 [Bosea sp. RCC_152_1]|uniref:hypothetical protein n=1 Tax=Bosea sp. RCC_152_1 TaxID=3239228 RepID=UPI0035268B0E
MLGVGLAVSGSEASEWLRGAAGQNDVALELEEVAEQILGDAVDSSQALSVDCTDSAG